MNGMLTLTIDHSLEKPVYKQIADQVRRHIASGAISPGTVLPPVRQLAVDLRVNLNTIARAYRLLGEENFLIISTSAFNRIKASNRVNEVWDT